MQLPVSYATRVRIAPVAWLFVLLWVGLFFYASVGVRGSDQFWYVSEVRAIMEGDPRSNSLWPHFVFSRDDYLQSRPFVHQGILPYVVALWKGILDPYKAWIFSNLLFVLSSAFLIHFALRRLMVKQSVAMMGSLLFLLMPSMFWYSTQPMVEPAAGLLCAALVAVTVLNVSHHLKFFYIALISLAGDFVTSIFLPVILISYIFYSLKYFNLNERKSAYIVCMNTLVLALSLIILMRKGSTLNFDIIQIMMNGTNGHTNMEIWLREEKIPFSASSYVEKLVNNVGIFFQINKNQLFLLPNILLILLVSVRFIYHYAKLGPAWMTKFEDKTLNIMFIIFFTAITIYFSIIFLHQNQSRYLNIIAPAIIVIFGYLYQDTLYKQLVKRKCVAIPLFFCMLGICALLAVTLRAESVKAADDVKKIRLDAAKYGLLQRKTIAIECYRGGDSLLLAYALPEVVFIHMDSQNAVSQLQRLKTATGAELYLCQSRHQGSIEGHERKLHQVENSKTLSRLGDNTAILSIK